MAEKPEAATAGTKVKWDDSGMKTTYANVCNVTGTREEVALLFGTNQTGVSETREFSVKLNDRIVVSPYVAKRLAALLKNVVEEYEKRFGHLAE